MLTAGCLKFDVDGRVIVSLTSPVVHFNGGTPVTASGALAGAAANPQTFLGSLGYRSANSLCARQVPSSGNDQGGLARDSTGGLALAVTEPITHYIAGLPLVADGRLAVSIEPPPPVLGGFTIGFEVDAFF